MKNLSLSILLLVFIGSAAEAASNVGSKVSSRTPEGYQYFAILAGLESRVERDQEQNTVDRSLQNWGLGIGYDRYFFSAEYSFFKEKTGQSSLVIDRKVDNYMLWGAWTSDLWTSFIPFVAAGIGQSFETIDTTLLGVQSTDKSKPQVIGGGSFGIRANMPILWFSLEFRVIAAERGEPNPTAGALGRLGFYF